MSQPLHQVWSDWKYYIHEDFHLTEADIQISTNESTSTLGVYPPSQELAYTAISDKRVNIPWSGTFHNDRKFSLRLNYFDNDLSGQRPAPAKEAWNHPPATPDAFSVIGGQSNIQYVLETESGIDPAYIARVDNQPAIVAGGTISSTSLPATYTTISPSVSHTPSQKRYNCAVCPRSFDRIQRARDCANKNLDLRPYVCGARCKRPNCDKTYSSDVHLQQHLASAEKRNTQCSRCGRTVLRKNIARHIKQKACLQNAQVP
ncbi:hypothetical protein M408DRAFT_30645 [Serendipita vermifera MAFF 305830]|uniref:C2H2-type domain-containing protein n=1 Tax=Serendipita vermifera MAFF 305830 TaxID=933852 RepID=A0A0C3A641_SERVB|nr:hypothetical protein M408DRAFT_30645 [Serendipita vermifera MAFF 305830]